MCVCACQGKSPGCFWTDSSKRPVFTSLLTESETGKSVNVQGCGCGYETESGRESGTERGVKELERAVRQIQHIPRKV